MPSLEPLNELADIGIRKSTPLCRIEFSEGLGVAQRALLHIPKSLVMTLLPFFVLWKMFA